MMNKVTEKGETQLLMICHASSKEISQFRLCLKLLRQHIPATPDETNDHTPQLTIKTENMTVPQTQHCKQQQKESTTVPMISITRSSLQIKMNQEPDTQSLEIQSWQKDYSLGTKKTTITNTQLQVIEKINGSTNQQPPSITKQTYFEVDMTLQGSQQFSISQITRYTVQSCIV